LLIITVSAVDCATRLRSTLTHHSHTAVNLCTLTTRLVDQLRHRSARPLENRFLWPQSPAGASRDPHRTSLFSSSFLGGRPPSSHTTQNWCCHQSFCCTVSEQATDCK